MAKEQDKKTTTTDEATAGDTVAPVAEETNAGDPVAPVAEETNAGDPVAPTPRRYKYKGPKYVPGMQRLTGDGGRYFDPIMMKDDEIDKLKKSNPDLVMKWWTEI